MKRLLPLIIMALCMAGCANDNLFTKRDVIARLDGISLNKSELTNLITGESRKLILSFSPAEAVTADVEWSSSDQSVVTVDKNGVITTIGLGQADITARIISQQHISTTCHIVVERTSGISITDVLLSQEVEQKIVFLRGDGPREYTYFIQVYNSLNKQVEISSTNPEAIAVNTKSIDGITGFELIPGTTLGEGEIIIASLANPEMVKRIPFSLITVNVTGVKLSLSDDGASASEALSSDVTISHSCKVRVVFATDNPDVKIPENKLVYCTSSDVSTATVGATGTIDPATNSVFINVTMVDTPANASSTRKSATITVRSDDGNYVATFTATAKMPSVTALILNQELTRPVAAGDTIILKYETVPIDAYIQSVDWTTADGSIASVASNGIVTINPNFTFNPELCTVTEIEITATSTDTSNGIIVASCKLRPFQYVPATGVMVTDQWGNRIPQHAESANSSKQPLECCVQYACGNGKNKTDQLSVIKDWANSVPAYADAPRVGCIPIYLTATPVPYTYPKIADPNQEFYWGEYSNSRFAIADPVILADKGVTGYNSVTGYANTYDKNDGKKADLLKGRTMLFFTGHGSSGADINNVRLWRVVPEDPNNGTFDRSPLMIFRTAIHTNSGNNDTGNNNPSINVDGGARIFTPRRPKTPKLNDPAPWPWPADAPNPKPTTGPELTIETQKYIRTQSYPAAN